MSSSGGYPRGISPGRKAQALSGTQQGNTQADPTSLVRRVLQNPALYPDEFLSWLPNFLKLNVNFKVQTSQLPANGTRHVVSASGEAAVFTNGWAHFDSAGGTELVSYWIDPFGHVHLDGVAKSGTINTGPTGSIFTLPAGWRPRAIMNFPVASNNAYGTCIVNPNGTVIAATGSNVYFSLSGITFRQFA